MTVPTISNLPTVPATSDPNFETEAPALFNHIKNTFVSEMNSAISFINSSTFDATVEFKNANFTAARNFLYMIDTSSGGVSVTLPLNPSTGDQLLLMDQKRSFGTNNLTIGRNGQNINGAASDVVSKSTGALIRCIFQSSYGWTVDLYEGEWESGTNAGDLVYNGGNVGIGTSSPSDLLDVQANDATAYSASGSNPIIQVGNINTSANTNFSSIQMFTDGNSRGLVNLNALSNSTANSADFSIQTRHNATIAERMRISSDGKVGIGTSAPDAALTVMTDGDTNSDGIILRSSSAGGRTLRLWATGDTAHIGAGNGTLDLILNHAGGNVGIGTSSPGAKLSISDTTQADGNLHYSLTLNGNDAGTVGESTQIFMGAMTSALRGSVIASELMDSGNSHDLIFKTNSASALPTEKMRITGGGNVGIGVGSPSAKLHVRDATDNGTAEIILANADTGIPSLDHIVNKISFYQEDVSGGGTGTTGAIAMKSKQALNSTGFYGNSADMGFYVSGNVGGTASDNATKEAMTIQRGTGNVGIGASSPSEKFYVATGEAHIDYASTPPLKGSALRLATNTTHSFICSNQYFGTDGTGGGGNGVRRARNGGCGNIAFDITSYSTAGDIKFETSPNSTQYALATLTERMRIKQAGDVQISTGNLVIGTAGKGIDFSATSGTGTSELLTDYEEGTFTPKFTDNQSTPNQASGSFSGTYTKIGRMVTISCFGLNLNTSGMTSTDPLKIRDLPFVNESTLSRYGSVRLQDVSFSGYCNVQISVGVSVLEIMENISGSGTNVLSVADVTTVGNTADILLTLTYETS